MLLTVSGPPGAGKSTTADTLAATFGLEHVSGGDIFRELAAERGLTAVELNQQAEEDDQIDRDLDQRLRTIALERDDILLESRLAGWLAGDAADIRVWLDAPLNVRAGRIADREDKSISTEQEETRTREESEALRYQNYYNIDIHDHSIYDLRVNTARWPKTEVPDILEAAIAAYEPASDEGRFPIEDIIYDF